MLTAMIDYALTNNREPVDNLIEPSDYYKLNRPEFVQYLVDTNQIDLLNHDDTSILDFIEVLIYNYHEFNS